MKKRNLFAEISEGFEAFTQEREGKTPTRGQVLQCGEQARGQVLQFNIDALCARRAARRLEPPSCEMQE